MMRQARRALHAAVPRDGSCSNLCARRMAPWDEGWQMPVFAEISAAGGRDDEK
jgi:hypothetical protein